MACCEWLYWVGVATVAYFAINVLSFVHQYYLSKTNLGKYKKKAAWAVVTGASDGIGKAMSIELGRRGFNVCLISRTKSKLEEVASTISEGGKVQTKTVAFDFSKAGDKEYEAMFQELKGIEIGVLVNNVGINYDYPLEAFEEDVSKDLSIIKVNCEAQVRMTKFVIPQMKERRSGAILNLSSISCCFASPMLSIYAATKSFNKLYSESLAVELRPYGIDVTAVTPSMVCSNMSARKKASFDCPSAKSMAINTLNQLGGPMHTFGHANHGIIGSVLTSLPQGWRDGWLLGLHKTVRSKAIKKREREAAAAKK